MTGPDRQEQRRERLTNARLYPLLWRMALPAMAGMSVSTVYSMTDTYFVGRLGQAELTAAVGIVFTFISLIQAVGFWFGYGSGNHMSRMTGRRDIPGAEAMAASGMVTALVSGAVITLAGLLCLSPLALLLGAGVSPGLTAAVTDYLRITLISVPVMLAANVLYNQMRLQGCARDAMLGMLAGMLINIALDPLFILTLGMGVAGAAWASLAGQSAGLALLAVLGRRNGSVTASLKNYRPDISRLWAVLAGGAPNFCRQAITSAAGVVLNQAAGMFGENAIAGMTVALRVLAAGYALVIGFGQGFQPICAVNYGAGRYTRVRKAFRLSLSTATVMLCAAAVLLYAFAEGLTGRFTGSAEVTGVGSDILRAQCFVLPFMGYYILSGMLLQNIGRFGAATLITAAESGLFLIPAALTLPRALGLEGLIMCKPAASACAAVFSLIIGTFCMRRYLPREDAAV